MSKNSLQSEYLKKYMNKFEAIAMALPHLARLCNDPDGAFRGLTMFLGDTNSIVVGVKRFAVTGEPEVIWSSGEDAIAAFINMENALSAGKWRLDKRVDNYKK